MLDNKNNVMNDDELEQVSGGFGSRMSRDPYTYMKCHNCNHVVRWTGNYMGGGPYICPDCWQETLVGDMFVE